MENQPGCDVATVLPDPDRTILDLPRQLVSPVSLELPQGVSIEAWSALLPRVDFIKNATNWWLGDLILYGEAAYGELHSQYLPEDTASISAYKTARWVASRIESERRRPALSWSHHREVAPLEHEAQEQLLDLALAENLSVHALRKLIKEKKGSCSSRGMNKPDLQGALAYSSNRIGRPWRTEDHRALSQALGLQPQSVDSVEVEGEEGESES
jgi:hypothetical protein